MSTPPLHLHAPPSKSATHRLMLLAALSDQPCTLRRPLLGDDCRSTLSVLQALGARAWLDADGDAHFAGFSPTQPAGALDCGNSGTTLRLMLGQAAFWPFTTTLTGDASLRRRPNGPLLDTLRSLGVQVQSQDGRAPIAVQGPPRPAPATGRKIALPGGLSSQYTSSLLLALAQAEGAATVRLSPPVASRPYLNLTVALAADFGLDIDMRAEGAGLRFDLPGGQRPRPPVAAEQGPIAVEGDWSGAAFPMVAAALTGVELRLAGLRWASAQGDRAILLLLRAFGVDAGVDLDDRSGDGEPAPANPTERERPGTERGPELGQRRAEPDARARAEPGDVVWVRGGALVSPGAIDVGEVPDLFPILCALAACARGTTRLHGSPGLRHKECDRIAAMAAGLTAMGVRCEELPDGLVVQGGRPHGADICCHEDHRIHMAFSVLGLVASGATAVDHPACVAVSYPDFHAHRAAFAERAADGPPSAPAATPTGAHK